MIQQKRYKKNYYRKKNYNNNNMSANKKASLALKRANKALKSTNAEFKVIDTGTTVVPSTSATLVLCNGIVQGDDYDNRQGRSIKIMSVELNIDFVMNASATNTRVRCMLVLDKDPKATALTINEVLASTGAPALYSPRNLNSRKRIVNLYDEKINMSINGNRGASIKYYSKLNFHTIFNSSNAGTIADIGENSLYLIFVSSEATNTPSVSYTCRLRFIDN